jgi:peptidyl-prolyl cis-trans isomerase-like protein 2
MKKLGKKAYVQLQTSAGNLNIELHCDIAPQTCWNFITLCSRGYYDKTKFHRLVPNFILQGGDPEGNGSGGESAWGKSFRDEFDSRLSHDSSGVLSMANSGPNTNGSQFFFTLRETKSLDMKHTVFGRVVGGAATLDRIEAAGTKARSETPADDVTILTAVVFSNPLEEAEVMLKAYIQANIEKRSAVSAESALPAKKSLPTVLPTIQETETRTKTAKRNRTVDNAAVSASSSSSSGSVSKRIETTTSSNADAIAAFLKSQNSNSFH